MREIKSLTAMRGIAAMAVVMQHFSSTVQHHSAVTIPSLVPHGYIAVDFFFVLSGFIMAYTYLDAFQRDGAGAFSDFVQRRIARIVPLNVAVLTILIACAAISIAAAGRNIFFTSKNLWFDLPANILMLQGLGIGNNLNGPSWSISTEFAAYILFPAFILVVFHRRFVISVIAVTTSIVILIWIASRHPRLGLDTDTSVESVLRCFTEFVMGMAANRLYRSGVFSSFIGRDLTVLILFAVCVLLLVLRTDLPMALAFPFLVVALAVNKGAASRLLSLRVPHFLGVISYSIYLIHNGFRPVELVLLRHLHPLPLSTAPALVAAMVGSLTVIPFAWVMYRLVERPGRALVRDAFNRFAPPESAAAPQRNVNAILLPPRRIPD